jgi:integrase
VRTKFAKTFRTYFKPIGGDALAIFSGWVGELEHDNGWGTDDPLFPPTQTGLDDNGQFCAAGILRSGWSTTQPINAIFKRAFAAAGLPYYNPHSFRDMLVRYGQSLNLTVEEFKAWSQNLGHADMLTTLTNYGSVPVHRQGELIRAAGLANADADWTDDADVQTLLKALAAKARSSRS